MSAYYFLASDFPIEEKENKLIEMLSIEEAISKGLEPPSWLNSWENLKVSNMTKKVILRADSEECFGEIEVREQNASFQARQFTDKKYISAIDWRYTDARALQLIEYFKEHLKTSCEIEYWYNWLDEFTEPHYTNITVDALTTELLKSFTFNFDGSKCLRIYK